MRYLHKNMVFYALIVKYNDCDMEDIFKSIVSIDTSFCWALNTYNDDHCINVIVGFYADILKENSVDYILSNMLNQIPTIEKFAIIDEMNLNAEFMKTVDKCTYSTFHCLPVFEWAKDNKHLDVFRSCDQNAKKYDFSSSLNKTDLKSIAKLISSELLDEVNRIYKCNPDKDYIGNPYNYIIEGLDDNEATACLLVNALKDNNRVLSRSLYYYGTLDRMSDVIEIMQKNTLIHGRSISYDNNEEFSDECFRSSRISIHDIIHKMRMNESVTIISTGTSSETDVLLNKLRQHGYYNMIVIRSERLSYKQARQFSKTYAKQIGIADDRMKDLMEYIFPFKDDKDKKYQKIGLKDQIDTYKYTRVQLTKTYQVYKDVLAQTQSNISDSGSMFKFDLDYLIGLKDIKDYVNKIVDTFKFYHRMSMEGLYETEMQSKHMVFTGNPGTAKTTVARSIYGKLRNEGIVTGRFIECGRADLIGKYVGWTAIQVRQKFLEAAGGVLFIDEAYSLVSESGNDFGKEAIATIIQEMESHAYDTIVIFAGYPKEMKAFIDSNPGLKSRVNFYVDFPDYSIDELVDILKFMARDQRLEFTNGALEISRETIKKFMNGSNFGNGRFIRNYLDKVLMNHASRLMSKTPSIKELITVTAEDCKDIDMDGIKSKETTIGF